MAALRSRYGHYILQLWFLLLLSFLAYSQQSKIGCLPYFHTWCDLSANLECMSEMCCTRLAEIQDAKIAKNLSSGHHPTTLSGYIFATKACIDNLKNLLRAISPTYVPKYGELWPIIGAEIGLPVWVPQQISRGFACWLRCCNDFAQRFSTKLCMMFWPSPGLVQYVYIFGGSCPLTDFYQVQNSLCDQVFHSSIFAALLHSIRVVGVSQTAAFSRGRHLYSAGRGHHVGHRPTF